MKISSACLLSFLILFLAFPILAQETMDGDFAFQTNNAKKYSLYIPSSYDANTPNDLMLGLHPFNVNRWDGEAWRDTLIDFAEQNNLILVCPDGGVDGRIDGAIDTSFTTALMDSVMGWYNINPDQKFITGFSVGGKTSYTYGLNHKNEYRGIIPIGAAITNADINPLLPIATDANFYVIHGSQDSPNVRYTPIISSLDQNGACVEGNLLSGVGHTVDFNDRNQILTDALEFLKSNNCETISSTLEETSLEAKLFPNPNPGTFTLNLPDLQKSDLSLIDLNGKSVSFELRNNIVSIDQALPGVYLLIVQHGDLTKNYKIMVM